MNKLVIEVEVPEQLLKDILVTCVEGGSDYWATFYKIKREENLDIISVLVGTEDDDADTPQLVHPDKLMNGFENLAKVKDPENFSDAPNILHRLLNDVWDANDADVLLQLTMFGEVIYG